MVPAPFVRGNDRIARILFPAVDAGSGATETDGRPRMAFEADVEHVVEFPVLHDLCRGHFDEFAAGNLFRPEHRIGGGGLPDQPVPAFGIADRIRFVVDSRVVHAGVPHLEEAARRVVEHMGAHDAAALPGAIGGKHRFRNPVPQDAVPAFGGEDGGVLRRGAVRPLAGVVHPESAVRQRNDAGAVDMELPQVRPGEGAEDDPEITPVDAVVALGHGDGVLGAPAQVHPESRRRRSALQNERIENRSPLPGWNHRIPRKFFPLF